MISGGIKFFEQNKCLLNNGGTAEVTTGEVVQDFLIDVNPITFWNSIDSTDLITEDIIIRFTEAEIDRIFLLDHNFKQYTIKYWDGATYQDFASVVGITGALGGGISETTFAKDTSYYEFTAVTTGRIKISVLKTQVVDDQKYLSQVVVTKELGTLDGFPLVNNIKHSRNSNSVEMLSGKSLITKSYESFSCKVKFDKYPASYADDLDLMFSLFDSQQPFLVWLCGGKYSTTYFKYPLRGFRLKDLYQCQIAGDLPVEFYKSVYTLPVTAEIMLQEHV